MGAGAGEAPGHQGVSQGLTRSLGDVGITPDLPQTLGQALPTSAT